MMYGMGSMTLLRAVAKALSHGFRSSKLLQPWSFDTAAVHLGASCMCWQVDVANRPKSLQVFGLLGAGCRYCFKPRHWGTEINTCRRSRGAMSHRMCKTTWMLLGSFRPFPMKLEPVAQGFRPSLLDFFKSLEVPMMHFHWLVAFEHAFWIW